MKALTVPTRLLPLDLTVPCVLWTGDHSDQGYGRVMIDSETKYVHRLTYQLHVGPVPRGWEIDHICHGRALELGLCQPGVCPHRACWEPRHLEAVTSAVNSARGGHPLFAVRRSNRCGRDHDLLDPANVYIYPSGKRRCLRCATLVQKERRSKR